MPTWGQLVAEVDRLTEIGDEAALNAWVQGTHREHLQRISERRGGLNVIQYGTAFLQKPTAPSSQLALTGEDLNGLMAVIHGMDPSKGLALLLHTPGGSPGAAETIVDYLRSKFDYIEVIVPTFAMSAGTMVSLASNKIIMGRQSQLGPIDPQLQMGNRSISARAIVAQFATASAEITANRAAAHVWAPVLQQVGPSLLVEAQNALDYGEAMVAKWLASRMFDGQPDADLRAAAVAAHFNDAAKHKSHGRRINRDEARAVGVEIEDLEPDQALQESVLTSYHVMTLSFERSPGVKFITNHTGGVWMKSWLPDGPGAPVASLAPQVPPPPAGGGSTPTRNRAERRRDERRK